MKKQVFIKITSALMALCMLFLSACASVPQISGNEAPDELVQNEPVKTPANDEVLLGSTAPKGEYNEGVVLVKCEDGIKSEMLGELDVAEAEQLYKGSAWYTVTLGESVGAEDAVKYLTELGSFDKVDYDYIMGVTADTASAEVSGNPDYESQKHHGVHKIPEGWEEVKKNGKHPGGSPDVVVAVIDTGVDYNHLDLRNNIWTNPAEIPDNGIDDDGNGYVDDIYGWDCVGDDKDPMDDNGHGTHVAGIIAAENNKIGGVGVAYNCKVMVLKAGNSSGYFNNSDIAEAIQYAYMNGASVINMSFGGSNISIAVEEALENAYNSCVLVAAAGNDGACNNLACLECDVKAVSYPAALPYVIGVMSTNGNGTAVSAFSNYDHYPYNSVEYEVFAVGEAVPSCWPGNKYATLNGTSMAAPTVSGIAALLRSAYPDRETYSTKYLQSQIVNTGDVLAWEKSVANVYDALTKLPTPEVNLYDYSINDSTSISVNNNGNGVIDAGETVRLYIALHNRGGIASNVNVSIDTMRNNDPSLTDPYFTFVNPTMQLSDIGTYSVRESGDKYFEIVVDANCPNDYLVNFNIRFTYENGLDNTDKTGYEDDGKQKAQFNVSRGFHLPSIIDVDTTYTADRLYIVGQDVVIPEGVTVTFEEGCEIQFYADKEYFNSPEFFVYGTLIFQGSSDNMVEVRPSDFRWNFACRINCYEESSFIIDYSDVTNLLIWSASLNAVEISNSYIKAESTEDYNFCYDGGNISGCSISQEVYSYENCYIFAGDLIGSYALNMINNYIIVSAENSRFTCKEIFVDNIVCSYQISEMRAKYPILLDGKIANNFFTSTAIDKSLGNLKYIDFGNTKNIFNNYYSSKYKEFANQVIQNYYDSTGTPTIDVYGSLADASLLWPYVVSVEMFDKDGNPITKVGKEEIKVRVTFNRPMDKNAGTFLTFGTIEPYADYRIDGEYISDTVWEGTYTLKAQIENGQNFLKVNQAWAAEDQTKTVFSEYQLHEFTIDTTAAMAMNLQAIAKENGIELTFAQDDYDTLLGYNIYRAESKDGNYVRLNPAILLPEESTFLDENAEPGKTYWYTYTVVLTDFSESNPAGKVVATAMDTLAPNMYHTPVNQGYMNNNLVISCTASDNVAIESVVLYYRAVGATEWKTLTMVKQNDKYSATVFGSDLTLDGIEYYIVAYDTNNSIAKGSAEAPYTVVIKDASSISRLGDVDGDGVVTTKDALMLMQCINGDLILSDDEFKRADLNKDGDLSSFEALRILQYINGNVNTLEM